MVDKDRIMNLLAILADYLKEINGKMTLSLSQYEKDPDIQRITERLLQLISEAELDIVKEINKGLEMRFSESEGSMISSLSGILGNDVVAAIVKRRNLRNQLVHAYTPYKQSEVFEQAKKTEDVKAFINAVKKFLNKS